MDTLRKLFITTVFEKSAKYSSIIDGPAITIMKAHVTGAITGIKQFSQRTVFVVDDGTGALDCVLWCKEADTKNISQLQRDIRFGYNTLPTDVKDCALSLLKSAEMSKVDDCQQFVHGDIISFMGKVKMFRGKPELEIYHCYKAADADYETLWMLDVLSCYKRQEQESKN